MQFTAPAAINRTGGHAHRCPARRLQLQRRRNGVERHNALKNNTKL